MPLVPTLVLRRTSACGLYLTQQAAGERVTRSFDLVSQLLQLLKAPVLLNGWVAYELGRRPLHPVVPVDELGKITGNGI